MYNTMARNSEPCHPSPPPPPPRAASLIIQLHARFHSNRKMYGNYCSIEKNLVVYFTVLDLRLLVVTKGFNWTASWSRSES